MKNILFILMMLCACQGWGQIAVVAHTGGFTNNNTVTSPSITTTGSSAIVVAVADYAGTARGTLSDSKGNTWTLLRVDSVTSGNSRSLIYLCNGPIVGTGHSFTYNGTATFPRITVLCLSGTKVVSPFDQQNGAMSAVSNTTANPGSVTPIENSEIVITAINVGGTGITGLAVNSGFTTVDLGASGGWWGGIAYKIQTTLGAENPTWTWTNSTQWATGIVTLRGATVAGGGGANWMDFFQGSTNKIGTHETFVFSGDSNDERTGRSADGTY